jgi:hypothetical protein
VTQTEVVTETGVVRAVARDGGGAAATLDGKLGPVVVAAPKDRVRVESL